MNTCFKRKVVRECLRNTEAQIDCFRYMERKHKNIMLLYASNSFSTYFKRWINIASNRKKIPDEDIKVRKGTKYFWNTDRTGQKVMQYLYLTRRGDLVVKLEKGWLRLRRPNLRIWGKPMLLKSICKGTQLTILFGLKLYTSLLT